MHVIKMHLSDVQSFFGSILFKLKAQPSSWGIFSQENWTLPLRFRSQKDRHGEDHQWSAAWWSGPLLEWHWWRRKHHHRWGPGFFLGGLGGTCSREVAGVVNQKSLGNHDVSQLLPLDLGRLPLDLGFPDLPFTKKWPTSCSVSGRLYANCMLYGWTTTISLNKVPMLLYTLVRRILPVDGATCNMSCGSWWKHDQVHRIWFPIAKGEQNACIYKDSNKLHIWPDRNLYVRFLK